jgi:putative flippase GtrA
MIKFLKAQASSLIGTGVDHLAVYLLALMMGGIWSPGINILGMIAGGVTNFVINRWWVFKKENKEIEGQAFRYGITWVGNLLLNTAGVWTVLHYSEALGLQNVHFVYVRIGVSLLIGFTYSYAMQKRFVFK